MKAAAIIAAIGLSGCVMPGTYTKSPGIEGTIVGIDANWVGVAIGIGNNERSCERPDQESSVDEGAFYLEQVKSTRIFGMPVPASCETELNLCLKSKSGEQYTWTERIIVDCNSIYWDFRLACSTDNGQLGCIIDHRLREKHEQAL